jgi:hypothetical protein
MFFSRIIPRSKNRSKSAPLGQHEMPRPITAGRAARGHTLAGKEMPTPPRVLPP